MKAAAKLSFPEMRARPVVVTLGVFACTALAIGPGCKDATQATVEIRIAKSDLCPKLGGTAIAVGADRADVEARISTYVTAETRDCDAASGSIGSLVVTPGAAGKSAIVVVVAIDTSRARSAIDCKPPGYAGCVVARRFFAFADHKNLRIPITIDPECVDVPCNASSTCRKGNCYDSTSSDGAEPGENGNVGTVDGSVDGFTPDGAKDGGADGDIPDGKESDADGGKPPAQATCKNGLQLQCFVAKALVPCAKADNPANVCCDNPPTAGECNPSNGCLAADRYCCINSDCNEGAGETCANAEGTIPGRCFLGVAPPNCPSKSTGPLYCPMAPCGGGMQCCQTGSNAACSTCPPPNRWCCDDSDCGSGGGGPIAPCVRDKSTSKAGRCNGISMEL